MILQRFLERHRTEQAGDDRIWTHEATGLTLCRVEAGTARLGSPLERVEVPTFSLARHPVTNAGYADFLARSGYVPADPTGFLAHWPAPGAPPPELLDHPVVHVSWHDAMAYCDWAGMTLPTEQMWEKAARGSDGRGFPWGDARPWRGSGLAHLGQPGTAPVGSYSRTRTPSGCEDLIGNVSEWCWPGGSHEPQGDPSPLHPVRGAPYMRQSASGTVDAAHRRQLSATRRNHWVGFRPAVLS